MFNKIIVVMVRTHLFWTRSFAKCLGIEFFKPVVFRMPPDSIRLIFRVNCDGAKRSPSVQRTRFQRTIVEIDVHAWQRS